MSNPMKISQRVHKRVFQLLLLLLEGTWISHEDGWFSAEAEGWSKTWQLHEIQILFDEDLIRWETQKRIVLTDKGWHADLS